MTEVLKPAVPDLPAVVEASAYFQRDDGIAGLDLRGLCIAQIEWPDNRERLEEALLLALELLQG